MADSTRSPFQIAEPPRSVGREVEPERIGGATAAERVAEMVASAGIFAFIKGTPQQPMCGFSANTVAILDAVGAPYATFDVLSDEEVRSAAKEHGRWPTFPQVYVRGELIGGNDIVSELYATGELQQTAESLR